MRYAHLNARRAGFARVRIDGNMYDLSEEISLEKNIKHTVEIVVDRLVINDTVRGRLADSIETALAQANGLVVIDVIGGEPMMFSQSYACPEHGVSVEELTPRMFSFNNPFGACEKCTGLGTFMKVDPARVIPDKRKSIRESAIKASGWYYAEGSISEMTYKALGKHYGFTLDTPIKEFSKEALHALLYGTGDERIEMQRESMFGSGTYYNQFEGIIPNIERRVRMQKNGAETLYFYTEKHRMENGEKWDTERPISQKQYEKYLLERDTALSPVRKTKYRFVFADRRCEIDVYPFSAEKAVLFQYGQSSAALPEEITVLREVTGDADYKNRKLAALQKL